MAETGQLVAWVEREKGFEIREAFRQRVDGHITRGAMAPN